MKFPGLLLALAFALNACAQNTTSVTTETTLIPRHAFFHFAQKSAVQISPNGEQVAYIDTEDGRKLVLLHPGEHPPVVVHDSLGAPMEAQWLPSGNLLAVFNRDNSDWLVELNTAGEAVGNDFLWFERIGIVTTTNHGTVIKVVDDIIGMDGCYRLVDGKPEAVPGSKAFDRCYFDDELVLRAGINNTNGGRILYRVDAHGKKHEVASYNWMEGRMAGVFRATGNTLYYSDNKGQDKAVLKALNTNTGAVEVLYECNYADLVYAGATFSNEGMPQAVVAYYEGLERFYLDASIQADFEYIEAQHPGDVSFVNRSADNSKWLIRYMDGGPARYYVYDKTAQHLEFLFTSVPQLDGYTLANRHPIIVEARDGLKLPCSVFLPHGSDADGNGIPDQPLPTVIYPHGGPWVGYLNNSWFANRSMQLLANRGYAVVRAEFRGAQGYGKAFVDAGNKQWGEAMHHDIVDIAQWVVDQNIADESKLGLWGWSYGGYATLAGVTFAPDLFQCGIGMYGVYNLETFLQLPFANNDTWRTRVGEMTTEAGLAQVRKHSPTQHAANIQVPLYLTHGGVDDRTPQSQSDALVAALQQHKKEVIYTVYPDEPHDYRQPGSWVSFWALGEQFLKEHLGGRAQPIGNDLDTGKFEIKAGDAWVKSKQTG